MKEEEKNTAAICFLIVFSLVLGYFMGHRLGRIEQVEKVQACLDVEGKPDLCFQVATDL